MPGRKDLVFLTEKTAKSSQTVAQGYDVIGSGSVEKDGTKMVEGMECRMIEIVIMIYSTEDLKFANRCTT
jgi:hypothetical protein